MESATRILHCINLIWITDIVELQYIMTARIVIHTYIYAFHRSLRLSPDNRMWNMSKTYKSIQDIYNYYSVRIDTVM